MSCGGNRWVKCPAVSGGAVLPMGFLEVGRGEGGAARGGWAFEKPNAQIENAGPQGMQSVAFQMAAHWACSVDRLC